MLITLDVCAAVLYAVKCDWRMAVYWLAAENKAEKAVLEEFENNKHKLVMGAQQEYHEFLQWKREKKEVKPIKKSK